MIYENRIYQAIRLGEEGIKRLSYCCGNRDELYKIAQKILNETNNPQFKSQITELISHCERITQTHTPPAETIFMNRDKITDEEMKIYLETDGSIDKLSNCPDFTNEFKKFECLALAHRIDLFTARTFDFSNNTVFSYNLVQYARLTKIRLRVNIEKNRKLIKNAVKNELWELLAVIFINSESYFNDVEIGFYVSAIKKPHALIQWFEILKQEHSQLNHLKEVQKFIVNECVKTIVIPDLTIIENLLKVLIYSKDAKGEFLILSKQFLSFKLYNILDLIFEYYPGILDDPSLLEIATNTNDPETVRFLIKQGVNYSDLQKGTWSKKLDPLEKSFLFDKKWIPNSEAWRKLASLYPPEIFVFLINRTYNLLQRPVPKKEQKLQPDTSIDQLLIWGREILTEYQLSNLQGVISKIKSRHCYVGTPSYTGSHQLIKWYQEIEKNLCLAIENMKHFPVQDLRPNLIQIADTNIHCGTALYDEAKQLQRTTQIKILSFKKQVLLFYENFQRGLIEELINEEFTVNEAYHVHAIHAMEHWIGLEEDPDLFTDTLAEYGLNYLLFQEKFKERFTAGEFVVSLYYAFYNKGATLDPELLWQWLKEQAPKPSKPPKVTPEQVAAWKLCSDYKLAKRRRAQVEYLKGAALLTQATLVPTDIRRSLFQDKSRLDELLPLPKAPTRKIKQLASQIKTLKINLQKEGVDYDPTRHATPAQAIQEANQYKFLQQYTDPESGKLTLEALIYLLKEFIILVDKE